MSGTSVDGIDISLVQTNGLSLRRLNKNYFYKYSNETKSFLMGMLNEDINVNLKRKQYLDEFITNEYYLALKHLNIIESIQAAQPTDGLWSDNRTDQQQIGVDYDELEWAMNELEKNPSMKGLTPEEIKTIQIYLNFNRQNQHKMNPIPVCEIPIEFLV